MKKLTIYNPDVQKYMLQNRLSTQKNEIIDVIRNRIEYTNQNFESLFPSRFKRKDVMDHIIYSPPENGTCKITAVSLIELIENELKKSKAISKKGSEESICILKKRCIIPSKRERIALF
ncbi:hypothetical protein [Bacillus cereus]|uniref:hypothetical protein n=1 Tax=Bacillus cereus TaxID=1396 RepID=UPI003EE32BC7